MTFSEHCLHGSYVTLPTVLCVYLSQTFNVGANRNKFSIQPSFTSFHYNMHYVKLHRVGLYTELLYAIIPYLVSVSFAVLISYLVTFYCFFFQSCYVLCPCIPTHTVYQITHRFLSLPFLGLGMRLFCSILHSVPYSC